MTTHGFHLLVLLSPFSQGGQDCCRPGVFSFSPREIEKRFSGRVSFLECRDKYVCLWSRRLFFRYYDGCQSDEDSMSGGMGCSCLPSCSLVDGSANPNQDDRSWVGNLPFTLNVPTRILRCPISPESPIRDHSRT